MLHTVHTGNKLCDSDLQETELLIVHTGNNLSYSDLQESELSSLYR